jgi:hypothetical protein
MRQKGFDEVITVFLDRFAVVRLFSILSEAELEVFLADFILLIDLDITRRLR